MTKPKVSVIIPVYNVEKYLRQCLDSVINQTLKDIEIICIEDGSQDSSPEILNEYAKNDGRLIIYAQKNSGTAVSRNQGLKLAKGKYIQFLDSDDYLIEDGLECFYNLAEEQNLNVIKSNFYFDKNGDITKSRFVYKNENQKQSFRGIFNYKLDSNNYYPWNVFVRKQVLDENNIRFLETVCYEDTLFNMELFICDIQNCISLNEYKYVYRFNDISTVNCKTNLKHLYSWFYMIDALNERCAHICGNVEFYENIFYFKMYCITGFMWSVKRANSNETICKFITEFAGENPYYALCINSKFSVNLVDLYFYLTGIGFDKEIYIYGAGIRCKNLIKACEDFNIRITGVTVTDIEKNPDNVSGIKVVAKDSVNKDAIVIVSAAVESETIKMNLTESGFKNIYILKDI